MSSQILIRMSSQILRRAGRLRQRSRASPSGRRGNPLASAGSLALRRLELERTSEETNEALGPECARRRNPQPSLSSPRFFRFRAPSAESLLKERGMERPPACGTPTVFGALRRNLLSPRWSRPEWLRNQSGAWTVAPLSGATPPPETHPGPKARSHYDKLRLSGNRPAAGPGGRFGAEFRRKSHRIGGSSHLCGGRSGASPPRAPVVSGAQLAGGPGIIESRSEVHFGATVD